MNYDFDSIIFRKNTGCIKYDLPEVGDRIPLWVADMDFATPPFIIDAMRRRLDHPVMGYPMLDPDYYNVISFWVKSLHGWDVPAGSIRYIPGIVKGIGMVLSCFFNNPAGSNAGTKVIIQPPVYHPFRILPQSNGYQVVFNPLIPVEEDGCLKGYRMDLEGLENMIDGSTKLLILSNPHNPAGICWTKEELTKLAHICASRGVTVISDEIHAEMALDGNRHIPFASVSAEAASCSITFMAPSKTFNIAGIVSSYAVVLNPELRERFFGYLDSNELDAPSIFSEVATMAAYREGAEWRRQMLEYVSANIGFTEEFLKKNIPAVKCLRPQASFLIWLDCRGLNMSQKELCTLIEDKAGLYLNDGTMFGPQGEGFFRLNVGCPRSLLASSLERLAAAVNGICHK